MTALHLAAVEGRRDVVELLLSKGADPNKGDIDQVTPLRTAIFNDKKEIISLLRSHGAKE